jgi:methylase of polypeptide subunit release factors
VIERLTSEMPLRFASSDDYARVVAALREADFNEETICRTLKLSDMSDLGAAGFDNTDLSGTQPLLALFIRIFLFFEFVSRFELELLLDSSTFDSFLALDILRPVDESQSAYYTPVFLYPVANLYITSDRPVDLNGSVWEPEDWVFPAIFEETLQFLRLLITSPADHALDLCAGSGIAALVLGQNAGNAVAVDITSRATRYAHSNGILNQCPNVEALQGDLYSAVAGRTFDRIVAHPPYVPALNDQLIYRDARETGEYLVRRIIEGLPQYLRAGGTYFGLSLNIDTEDLPFEERARQWLGDARHEFDLVFAVGEERTLESIIQRVGERDPSLDATDLARMRQALSNIKATRFIYGALAARRRMPEEQREPFTLRVKMNDATAGADFEEALRSRSWPALN